MEIDYMKGITTDAHSVELDEVGLDVILTIEP